MSLRLLEKLKWWKDRDAGPISQRRGAAGERAAKERLQRDGLKFLTANFRSERGEIDLVFRDGDCLVFVEVKTRTRGGGSVPRRRSTRANAGP